MVVYTKKGISVEWIEHDKEFWEKELLPKLTSFYDGCVCPSIVSPVHLLGMKVHDLRVHSSLLFCTHTIHYCTKLKVILTRPAS